MATAMSAALSSAGSFAVIRLLEQTTLSVRVAFLAKQAGVQTRVVANTVPPAVITLQDYKRLRGHDVTTRSAIRQT